MNNEMIKAMTETWVDENDSTKHFDNLMLFKSNKIYGVITTEFGGGSNKASAVPYTINITPEQLTVQPINGGIEAMGKIIKRWPADILTAMHGSLKIMKEQNVKDRETYEFPMARIEMCCEMKKKFHKPSSTNIPGYCIQFVDSDFIVRHDGKVTVLRKNLGELNCVIDFMINGEVK